MTIRTGKTLISLIICLFLICLSTESKMTEVKGYQGDTFVLDDGTTVYGVRVVIKRLKYDLHKVFPMFIIKKLPECFWQEVK